MSAPPSTVWDPFDGVRPFEQTPVAPPAAGFRAPPALRSALGLATIAGAVLILGGLFSTTLAWAGAAVLALGVGGLMAADILGKTSESRDYRFRRIAERNGWGFRLIDRQRRRARGGRTFVASDPLAIRVHEAIPELLAPTLAQPVPFQIMAMFWGRAVGAGASGQDGAVPFWMALAEYEMDARLAAEALRHDGFGNRGARGRVFRIAAACDLGRDTGMRARLLSEPLHGEGWQELLTASEAFDRAFSAAIDVRRQDANTLLRCLTPRAQAVLLDLHARYGVQAVIDGPTLFLSGQDRINSEDDAVLARDLAAIVDRFAAAALALSRAER